MLNAICVKYTKGKERKRKYTFPTNDGMLSAFVANPIPNAMASSVPRNSASKDSSFRCCIKVPEIS